MNTSATPRWQPSEPFRPRPIHFHEVREVDGWRLKLYAIRYGDAPLETAIYDEVFPQAWYALPRPPVTAQRPGLGFVIQHQGRSMHYLVLCWWDNENELCQRVFVRRFAPGEGWRPATGGESACVWDLQVIWFERQTYLDTMLSPGVADPEAYLARRLEVPA
jgi:hypothetical protein